VEKNQYDLCHEILRRFSKAGILDNFILIGSWCVYFYKDYFEHIPYIEHITIKTRDIDFLIDAPAKIKRKADIPALVKDLGFVSTFKGGKGYLKLDHADLIIEFLVPEKGRGINKPYPLPQLGINATPLRFLNFLSTNTIRVKVEDFYLILPHPANFGLHKLIIFQRRTGEEKAIKDKKTALDILKALIDKEESSVIRNVFNSTPQKWQKKIIKGLEESNENEILGVLK
jgi:hypothetical protein